MKTEARRDEPGFRNVPQRSVVTGSTGFAGRRLVEMLVERGAEKVVAFDVAPPAADALDDPRVVYVQGDIRNAEDVLAACRDVDCCFHLAALVGPYYTPQAFEEVNYRGTLHVLDACKKNKIPKLVMSSSPSTRFPCPDPSVRGLGEDELERLNGPGKYSPTFHAEYARTKAKAEAAVLDACCDDLMTIAVAPHQLYGPRDPLLFPSLLDAAKSGKLRVFGDGKNRVSFTHIENYCHALILGAEALYPDSVALAKFYVVTDPDNVLLWDAFDSAVTGFGLPSIKTKRAVPLRIMVAVASVTLAAGHVVSRVTGRPLSEVLRKFKLTPFSVRMLVIDRWFDFSRATRDIGYQPLLTFEDGWRQTTEWFRTNGLPSS